MKIKWYGAQVSKTINTATMQAIFESGEEIVKVAAGKAPRESGDLANSGYVSGAGRSTYRPNRIHNREVEGDAKTVVAGFAAFYARFVEFGTRRQPARPFFRPTVDEMKGQFEGMIVTRAKRKVNK